MNILYLSKDEKMILCPNPACVYQINASPSHFDSCGTLMVLPCPKCQTVGVKPEAPITATLQERGIRYGLFADNARVSQALEEVLKSGANYQETKQVHREALKFICQKMSRIVNGDPDYKDNWHDITGYSTLAEKECK